MMFGLLLILLSWCHDGRHLHGLLLCLLSSFTTLSGMLGVLRVMTKAKKLLNPRYSMIVYLLPCVLFMIPFHSWEFFTHFMHRCDYLLIDWLHTSFTFTTSLHTLDLSTTVFNTSSFRILGPKPSYDLMIL